MEWNGRLCLFSGVSCYMCYSTQLCCASFSINKIVTSCTTCPSYCISTFSRLRSVVMDRMYVLFLDLYSIVVLVDPKACLLGKHRLIRGNQVSTKRHPRRRRCCPRQPSRAEWILTRLNCIHLYHSEYRHGRVRGPIPILLPASITTSSSREEPGAILTKCTANVFTRQFGSMFSSDSSKSLIGVLPVA
jgi:hypothetical protein